MTEQQYIDKLKAMILLYKEIKKASVEFKDAGFAFPTAMSVSAYDDDKIHMHGNKLPRLDFKRNNDQLKDWILHSAELGGVTLFYLTHKEDREEEDDEEI